MKRMIAESLITWVKSLFHRIAPGTGEGDIEIGGNLEVDGNITAGGRLTADTISFADRLSTGAATLGYAVYNSVPGGSGVPITTNIKFTFQGSDVFNLYARATNNGGTFDNIYVSSPRGLIFNNEPTFSAGIKIGSTELTEEQLQKLIALIPAE